MVKTVIVPLDGSERADAALAPAEWLADALDADLVLVTSTYAGDTSAHQAILTRGLERTRCRHARAELRRGAHPAADILRVAAESPDPVICMSTHGRRALPTMVAGSVAHEVLTRGAAPVVLVGPSFDPDRGQSDHDLVVALQGCPEGSSPLPVSTGIAHDLDLRTHVVHVAKPTVHGDGDGTGPVAAACARQLQHMGVDARGWDLVGDAVAPPILDLVRSLDACVLAVGRNQCPDGIERTLGRTALALLRDAPCPVMVE